MAPRLRWTAEDMIRLLEEAENSNSETDLPLRPGEGLACPCFAAVAAVATVAATAGPGARLARALRVGVQWERKKKRAGVAAGAAPAMVGRNRGLSA